MSDGPKRVRSGERILDILSLFLNLPGPLGVGEVARRTGIPKSTAYRLLLTLESRSFLVRSDPDEKFRLSPRIGLAHVHHHEPDLRMIAQSVIDGLRDTCGETIGLHQLTGDERVCIAAAEGIRTLRTSGRVGSRAPLYSGASARAIMAFLPEARWEQIIASTGLRPLTSRTITEPSLLKMELNRIRVEGYAVSTGEWDEGITSLAAPVFNGSGEVVGSMNISGPSFRFGDEKISLLVGALKAAAMVVSQRLKAEEESR